VTDGEKLFRKDALDKLASPEQLDELIVVVEPRRWVALAAMLGLLLLALVWSIVGRLPSTVGGKGILLRTGGVQDVVSTAGGQVVSLRVDVGDLVEVGTVVAVLAQPDLEKELESEKAQLAELRIAHTTLAQVGEETARARGTTAALQRASLAGSIGDARRRLAALQEKQKAQAELLERGLITRAQLQQTEAEMAAVNAEVRAASVGVSAASTTGVEDKARQEAELAASLQRISAAERQVASLEAKLERARSVTSPYRGRVLELKVDAGALLNPGSPILNLDPDGAATPIEVLAYVAAGEGKLIRPGMKVQISPSTAKKEEFGFLLGEVSFVADFPATNRGMMRLLDNEALVASFVAAAGGAPLMIKIALVPDPKTPTGFAWSSGQGPPQRLTTGTPCAAMVTTKERAPITLMLPALQPVFDP
jgi:HlyD family secretion protein